jgi:hypothetical protein
MRSLVGLEMDKPGQKTTWKQGQVPLAGSVRPSTAPARTSKLRLWTNHQEGGNLRGVTENSIFVKPARDEGLSFSGCTRHIEISSDPFWAETQNLFYGFGL